MAEDKDIKQQCSEFDAYLTRQRKLGEVGPEEMEEMREIFHELIQNGEDWREFVSYKRIDVHPDPERAKMGRPI